MLAEHRRAIGDQKVQRLGAGVDGKVGEKPRLDVADEVGPYRSGVGA